MIPYFFFGLFDSGSESAPDEIKTSAKGSHNFIRRGFNFINRNAATTQYVDDSVLIKPKTKQKQQVNVEQVTEFKYKPYSNNFINAIENSHLKAEAIIKSMIEKADKARALKQDKTIRLQKLQDDEDESILMLMFEMI